MDADIAKRAKKAAAKRAEDGSAVVEAKEAKELAKRAMKGAKAKEAEEAAEAVESEEGEDEDEDEEESEAELVHESLKTPAERRKRDAKKYVPENESKADRERRTIFIGNVPIECVKEKVSFACIEAVSSSAIVNPQSAQSSLKAHIRTFVPTAKIESVRFRSVAFSKPTVALPDDDEKDGEGKRARREKARAAAWRDAQGADEGRGTRRGEDDVVDKSKSFLDAKGKRKVAFIKKDVSHPSSEL